MKARSVRLGLLFLFSLAFCITANFLNKQIVKQNNPTNQLINTKALVYDGTIYSIDNEWYVDPIKNYLEQSTYAIEVGNPLTQVRRTPGYPVFLGVHYKFFGYELAHKILPFTQSLIYALSVLVLWLITLYFARSERVAWIVAVLYSFCPFTIGYVFYTITEAIYPAFVIFTIGFFVQFLKTNKWIYAYLCGLLLAAAFLIRPTNILLLPILMLGVFIYWIKYKKYEWKWLAQNAFIFILGIITLEGPWVIRNYQVTNGEFVPLEKIYNESAMGMGRSQSYFSKWAMCFSNPRPEEMVHAMVDANELDDSIRYKHIDNYIDALPSSAFAGYEKNEVKQVLAGMQNCYNEKLKSWGTPYRTILSEKDEMLCDIQVMNGFQQLIKKYKANNPFHYYIIAPYIIRGKEFVFQSFTSMYGSLNPSQGELTFIQKIIKAVCYGLNLLLFLATLIVLFLRKDTVFKVLTVGFPVALFIFFVNISHIEARYFLAAYPFMFINLGFVCSCLFQYLVSKRSEINNHVITSSNVQPQRFEATKY